MRRAIGFMTDDDVFFESEAEAEFHEAETHLLKGLAEAGVKNEHVDRFCETVVALSEQIRRYVDAYKEVNQAVEPETVAGPVDSADDLAAVSRIIDGYSPDIPRGEEDTSSVQFQSPDRRGTVSDLGSRPRPKAVQDGREGDGS